MASRSMLVLDANILVRAVLGNKILSILLEYSPNAEFRAPESAFEEAAEHLPGILERRGIRPTGVLASLDGIASLVQPVGVEVYSRFESVARARMARRDEDDWPILATALALQCPIWTEDGDFFGCGVATWTTDRIELYLTESVSALN